MGFKLSESVIRHLKHLWNPQIKLYNILKPLVKHCYINTYYPESNFTVKKTIYPLPTLMHAYERSLGKLPCLLPSRIFSSVESLKGAVWELSWAWWRKTKSVLAISCFVNKFQCSFQNDKFTVKTQTWYNRIFCEIMLVSVLF